MKFEDIELNKYLVSPNKSFLYHVYEKDYHNKRIKVEVLDVLRPLLKFSNNFRFQEFNEFKIFEKYETITKEKLTIKQEKMNREKLEGKILEILSEYNFENGGMIPNVDTMNIARQIMNLIPKTSMEQVEEFMSTAKQPTTNKIDDITPERRIFRVSLLEEELKEFIDSKTPEERLDALGDMQYVLDGLIIEEGFKDVIEDVVSEIHRSNMSKFDTNVTDATTTYEKYQKEGIETYGEVVGNNIVTYRSSDSKVLKSCNYSPPNLKPFLL